MSLSPHVPESRFQETRDGNALSRDSYEKQKSNKSLNYRPNIMNYTYEEQIK